MLRPIGCYEIFYDFDFANMIISINYTLQTYPSVQGLGVLTQSKGQVMVPILSQNSPLQWVITGRNEVMANVMFLLVSVILLTRGWGVSASFHACWDTTTNTPPPEQTAPPPREQTPPLPTGADEPHCLDRKELSPVRACSVFFGMIYKFVGDRQFFVSN